ncbi:MAG: tannase/feruloyl esterase family alpha/beta hydrolase [Terriglobia bacterium]|nr:MAG: tannase/feruloyl esterase family alpha/beta hydrolase [Terriglobia bacterium]
MNRAVTLMLCALGCSAFAFGQAGKSCESLKSLSLPDTTITAAEMVPAGPLQIPGQGQGRGGPGPAAPAPMAPEHCRVAAVIAPSADSHIEVEFWMPATDWNGKFEAVGNGGFAGIISFPAMAAALREGYATASTDTGHKGGSAVFALGHSEKMIDFAYRSVHEMTVKAKSVIAAYYGRGPRLSYWNGCSTGGRQGLKEAQRFPEDFDAILAGAPANYETHLHAWTVEIGMAAIKDDKNLLPASVYPVINKAVLAACDNLDGVKDGLLNDPRKCRFDPATLLCGNGKTENCLSEDQVEAVKKIYTPAKTRKGELIFPSYQPGSEMAWGVLVGGNAPATIGQDTFMYLTYADPKWDWHTFDLDRDTAAADKKDDNVINAIDPDLSKFKAHGGKLLMYHGWNDTAIAPENSINYYSSVLQKMGSKQNDWYRLFMAPGMQHCGGGPGPNQFNMMGTLERWREGGVAPEMITATHVTGASVDMTRPLCPYPQIAVYKGVGSTNDAASFTCKAP